MIVAPSIIGADFLHLEQALVSVEESGADWLHIDLMDGHFVPNISLGFYALEAIARRIRLPLDVHLMLTRPEDYLSRCFDLGVASISLHVEACGERLLELLAVIKRAGCRAGVAFSPATSLSLLDEKLWRALDQLLLMSVEPGFGGQHFLTATFERIKKATALQSKAHAPCLVVDGGIGLSEAPGLMAAGANAVVVGKAFFGAEDKSAFVSAFKP